MNQYVFAIDTSVGGVNVALFRYAKDAVELIDVKLFSTDNSASETLPHIINDILGQHGLTVESLENFCVSIGPGSFTGIRIGLAYLHGLNGGFVYSGKKPKFYGYSALSMMYKAILEAKAGEVLLYPSTKTHGYLVYQESGNPVVNELVEYNKIDSHNLLKLNEKSSVVVINSLKQTAEVLKPLGLGIELWEKEDAAKMEFKGLQSYLSSASLREFKFQVPKANYLRKSTVEEKMEIKKG